MIRKLRYRDTEIISCFCFKQEIIQNYLKEAWFHSEAERTPGMLICCAWGVWLTRISWGQSQGSQGGIQIPVMGKILLYNGVLQMGKGIMMLGAEVSALCKVGKGKWFKTSIQRWKPGGLKTCYRTKQKSLANPIY